HLPTVSKIYLERPTRVFEHYKNPANSQIYAENVWGKAMARTNVDKWSPEKAADEAIGRVKTIVAQWGRGPGPTVASGLLPAKSGGVFSRGVTATAAMLSP